MSYDGTLGEMNECMGFTPGMNEKFGQTIVDYMDEEKERLLAFRSRADGN